MEFRRLSSLALASSPEIEQITCVCCSILAISAHFHLRLPASSARLLDNFVVELRLKPVD